MKRSKLYYLEPLDGKAKLYYLEPDDGREVYYLEPEGEEEQGAEWQFVGNSSFPLTLAVLTASWDKSPGAYSGAGGYVTIPWASQVRIVPVGGYQIAHNVAPIHYTCCCDFKTQIEFYAAGVALPAWFSTAIEAAANWLRGPFEMALGDDKKLVWGAGDDPLGDNTSDAVTFEIWAK